MENQIRVELSHESHKITPTKEETENFLKFVNLMLNDDKKDIIRWGGYVERIETASGNFRIVPHCDNTTLLYKMMELLPDSIPSQ